MLCFPLARRPKKWFAHIKVHWISMAILEDAQEQTTYLDRLPMHSFSILLCSSSVPKAEFPKIMPAYANDYPNHSSLNFVSKIFDTNAREFNGS